jgi:hypothetical protein
MPEDDENGVRQIAAANLERLRQYHKCPRNHGGIWRHEDIAHAASVGKGTVGRIARASVGTSIDSLDVVAQVFELRAWQLLVPHLKPDDPPVVHTETEMKAIEAEYKADADRRFDEYVQALAQNAKAVAFPLGAGHDAYNPDASAHRQDSGPKPAPKRRRA